ncbi:putative low molecular weight phosphotyrosine protein phosphatase [Naematelia encephala]|uniref:Putative low molecular weight phosphotyrosine protein phosphatase n=1 Tax=Naematelia encephala TaxID=71784 RepID=A0A1Y2AQZ0_9TREE|nr:putative low molecular weight phosphotyrosine protein phosphatase [Naematelia encephala]
MAEAVFKHQLSQRPTLTTHTDVLVDSCGTGAYHQGDDADERTVAVCRKHGVPISCTARALSKQDFSDFDYILAMDRSNLRTLQDRHRRSAPSSNPIISLFGSFDPSILQGKSTKAQEVEDPYYGGRNGFDECYKQCLRYSEGLLDVLEGKAELPQSQIP